MAHSAFDPRKIIRAKIGTNHVIDGETEICISVTDDDGHTVYVPIYLTEEEAIECPPYPYIRLDLLSIPAVPHNIGATVRQHNALIGIDIGYNDMEGIDVSSFGKKIADKIVDLTRTHQTSTDGIQFYSVGNQGRIIIENRCEEVILHWVMELGAKYNDAC
ncbi:unnamed protein product [marine sediment metagenome]|uniref:Uncharacterized protein n=1 Tax=marine sediment metagenome TaxID=412755 RepID=X0T4A1_9ZZZZ